MSRKGILIGILGILLLLLALAGTGSAKSGYVTEGANCDYCHDSTFSLIEKGIYFKELHKFNGATVPNNAAHCNECHIDITVFLPLTSRGENYSNSHRYNDTTLASERLAPFSCFDCHIDVNAGNYTFITGISATYLTSSTCENCHKAKYDDWKGTMHRVMLTNNVTAQGMGLPTPSGSWANISYVIVGKSELRYLNETGYLFKRYFSENQTFIDYGLSQYTCGRCHTTGYSPDGNQSGLPGIVGTWSEPGIACEKCHGPGGKGHHVEANVSEQVCLQCHNGSTRQGTFLSSAHSPPLKAPVSCLKCHSPFDYARNNTVTSTTAINVVCANCHNSHNTSDNKYRELFSPDGFDPTAYADVKDAKNSFFNSSASRILLTGGATGTLTAGKDAYDILITPALIPSDIIDESYPGPINVTGPISEVLCSNCHYEHGLSHIAGVNMTHARFNYPGLGLAPATCTDCHMSGNLKSHSFNVKDENNFPSRTCSRGTECHVTSDQNLNHSQFSVVPVVNEWKSSGHNNSAWGVDHNRSSCARCHSPINWNPLNASEAIAPEDYKGVTCAICHNIHDMGDWLKKTNQTFGELKPYAWYKRDAFNRTTHYRANYTMEATTTGLCTNCHQNRPEYSVPGWGSRGPHGAVVPHTSTQKEMFMGSIKESGQNFECADCHMYINKIDPTNATEPILPDSQKVTGHTFRMNVTGLQNAGQKGSLKCADCHIDGSQLGNLSTKIDSIQTAFMSKWNATNDTVENAWNTYNVFTGEKNLSGNLLAEAFFKLYEVKNDRSWGVHDPLKANNLLNESSTLANDAVEALGITGATFKISGFKIDNDTGMGLANWNITLTKSDSTVLSNMTDSSGMYQFMNLPNGTYTVAEEMQTGWTNVSQMSIAVTINGADMMYQNISNRQLQPEERFNISGFKIDNITGMGLANWNITLTKPDSTVLNNVTDSSGMYQFMNLPNGAYTVAEEMQTGWTNVSPMSIAVTINGADMIDQNFTNAIIPPQPRVTSFELTPGKTAALNGSTITITVKALNVTVIDTNFNGMANITVTANKNANAVIYPPNVTFNNGIAILPVTSNIVQFVTVTATNGSITGSTDIVFADRVFDLHLGWNLISIPSFADPSSVSLALKNVKNNGVVGYDPATKTFSTPTDLQPLYGYWINVTSPNQSIGFIANIMNPTGFPPSRDLYEGWNLIGISADHNADPADSISGTVLFHEDLVSAGERLYTRLIDKSSGNFYTGAAIDGAQLKQGQGYWLFIKSIPNKNVNNVPWSGNPWY